MCLKQKKELSERNLNIWNRHDFAMSGLGEKSRIIAKIKHFGRCLKWSRQRVVRGYADCDVWSMCSYLQELIPEVFGKIVPLRELPQNVSNEDLIAAINDSIEQNCDLLLERFGFKELESNKNILM